MVIYVLSKEEAIRYDAGRESKTELIEELRLRLGLPGNPPHTELRHPDGRLIDQSSRVPS